ncbi:uncharacterized protein EAF01_000840 [Botrytis porri]|uniref:uncharacterized protein n=1 Tax=Botrytis porri TaxID=87229 RepID=UPI001900431D|nr:uncharacterized protein EAF01_000840 [Botrytis porri]KAF7914434.1 hypothetical protein EAF01_000840 [Botrytis porri]
MVRNPEERFQSFFLLVSFFLYHPGHHHNHIIVSTHSIVFRTWSLFFSCLGRHRMNDNQSYSLSSWSSRQSTDIRLERMYDVSTQLTVLRIQSILIFIPMFLSIFTLIILIHDPSTATCRCITKPVGACSMCSSHFFICGGSKLVKIRSKVKSGRLKLIPKW